MLCVFQEASNDPVMYCFRPSVSFWYLNQINIMVNKNKNKNNEYMN